MYVNSRRRVLGTRGSWGGTNHGYQFIVLEGIIMVAIYKITNIKNGKIYVGQTTQSLNRRLAQHIGDSKRIYSKNRLLCQAIREDGKENFIIEKIEECEDTCRR